jgi:O-antigen ligase
MTVKVPIARGTTDRLGVITQIAFVLALALVAARCTILESVREPFQVSPGVAPYPLGPGPATSLAIDLLCCLPAILVILRRALERSYTLRHSWSQFLAILLAAWAILSIKWANDKFIAMVSAADFSAAIALFWAGSQLVRTWARLRIVSAVAYGLLLVLLVQGFYYKFVELPDLIHSFEQNKQQILRDRGFAPDSFAAKQFENKIVAGELLGFSTSENSFAAMIVLLAMIGVGAIIQRRTDRDPAGWIALMILPLPFAAWLLFCTQSKAGMATPILGLILLWGIWQTRGVLATRPAKCFYAGLTAIVCALAAVIGFGLARGRLPTSSLNFRWRYWTAAWRMFWRHPIRGIGWANFGPHYLHDRLPSAAEEIRDPHNFIIRFFVELGAIGGILTIAWMVRLWWDLTRPITPPPPSPRATKTQSAAAAGFFFGVAGLAMTIATIASLDFSQDPSFIVIELMKRCLYLCALGIGAMLVGLRSVNDPRLDDRPAPWILYGLLVSLGLFLIHNLIEFSLFEPGPMCLFGLLSGAALGARQPSIAAIRPRAGAAATFILATVSSLAAAIFVWLPVTEAENLAQSGDESLRTANLNTPAKFDQAAAAYQQAFDRWPLNADYAFRAGRALQIELDSMLAAGKESQVPPSLRVQIRAFYTAAISRDPSDIPAYLQRAGLALQIRDADAVISDFDRAVWLNPNDIGIRLQYAQALQTLRLNQRAVEQLKLALFYNDGLDAKEPRRLPEETVKEIQKKIDSLGN